MIDGESVPSGNEIRWYIGEQVSGENIGTGDGIETEFDLLYTAAEYTEEIYVDSQKQEVGTDYTINYRPGTGKTHISFITPPGSGTTNTANYMKVPHETDEALLSYDFGISNPEDRIEQDIHGENQKLTKSAGYTLKIKLDQVWGNTEKLSKQGGELSENQPVQGVKTWKIGGSKKIPLLYGRLVRNGEVKMLIFVEGAKGTLDITMNAKEFFKANSAELTVDSIKVIEDM